MAVKMKSLNERLGETERILDRGKNRRYFNGILLGTLLALSYPNLNKIAEYKVPLIQQEFREEIKKPYSGRKNDVFSLEAIADNNLRKEIVNKTNEINANDFYKIARRISRFNPIIEYFSEAHNVDDALVAGIIYQESLGNPRARSRKGALGLMQLMASTAKEVAHKPNIKKNRKMSTRDKIIIPEYNLEIGTRYLSALIKMYEGNIILGLAAYNSGPTTVNDILRMRNLKPKEANWHNIRYLLPRETRDYIPKVFSKVLKMRGGHTSGIDKIQTY